MNAGSAEVGGQIGDMLYGADRLGNLSYAVSGVPRGGSL
jgi:hypothetical protein